MRPGASRFSFTRTRHVGRATARERAAMATRRRRLSSPRAAAGDHPRSGSHVTDARAPAPILIGCACLRAAATTRAPDAPSCTAPLTAEQQRHHHKTGQVRQRHATLHTSPRLNFLFFLLPLIFFSLSPNIFLPLATVIGEMLRGHVSTAPAIRPFLYIKKTIWAMTLGDEIIWVENKKKP